jgi:peroxiredoxin
MAELAIGTEAPELVLLGEGERPVRLSELRGRGPLVLVFLRHFG